MVKKKDRTEITPALEQRIGRVREKARDYIAKTEVVQFRLDEITHRELFSIAEQLRRPVGSIVREWVTERIKQELVVQKTDNRNQPSATTSAQVADLQNQIEDLRRIVSEKLGNHKT